MAFNGLGAAERSYTAYYRILSVRMDLGGGVPAGLVRGRHSQPGSTRTPSPACGSGKQQISASAWGTTLATSATGDAGPSPHQGQTVEFLGIPEGQRYRSGVATSLDTML